MLRHRGRLARPHGHPGVPRRPARHRHHGCRRSAQWPAATRQVADGRAAGHLRRRRGCARLRGLAGRDGIAARERDADRHQRRGAHRPSRHAAQHGALRPRHQRHDTGGGAGRRGRVPRPLRAGRVEAGMAAEARGKTFHPGPGQSSRAPPGRTPSSPPAVPTTRTRSTTSCASRSSSAARWTSPPPPSTRR